MVLSVQPQRVKKAPPRSLCGRRGGMRGRVSSAALVQQCIDESFSFEGSEIVGSLAKTDELDGDTE